MDATTRQVIAFHVGDRSGQSAATLWEKIPSVYHGRAMFYTDQYAVYTKIIPSTQHRTISKLARKTNHVERFNCTLRQRVSRLVRATLSFSKKLSHHIGAIKYYICHYSLTKCAALPQYYYHRGSHIRRFFHHLSATRLLFQYRSRSIRHTGPPC